MHTEQELAIDSVSVEIVDDPIKSISEVDTLSSSPTLDMGISKNSEFALTDLVSSLPYVLPETPSPLTEEPPTNSDFQKKKEREEDWDAGSVSISFSVGRTLTWEERRNRRRKAYLKLAATLLSGIAAVLAVCMLLVKWIHEYSRRSEDELVMVALVFLALAMWSTFLLLLFQFIFTCPTDCDFAEEV